MPPERFTFGAYPHPDGHWVKAAEHHGDAATSPWVDAPNWPTTDCECACEYANGRRLVYRWDAAAKEFRNDLNRAVHFPLRYCVFLPPQEITYAARVPVEPNELTDIIGVMMRYHTVTEIMDAMDKHLGTAGTGAPE